MEARLLWKMFRMAFHAQQRHWSAQEIQSSRYTSAAIDALTTCPLTSCGLSTKPLRNTIQYVLFRLTVWNSLHLDSCQHPKIT